MLTVPRSRTTTQAPRIDPISLGPLTEGDPDRLERDADLEGVRYADLSLGSLDLPGALVSSSRFDNVSAHETDLTGARLVEVELDRIDLPVVRAARSQWRDVRVNGRLGSLEAYESQWRGVHLVGCKLGFVNLRGAELLDVSFTDCIIEELDLVSASARRLRLEGCRVARLNVQHARLVDVDLRGALLESVDGVTGLAGTTVSPEQLMTIAPLLAEGVGIRVE
jgi:uncharacterized protein YjbI with pentapeptide repeats